MLSCWNFAQAQLTVTASANATQLAQNIVGPGITVSNVVLNCPGNGAGTFNGAATNLGINSGVLLTTGTVATAAQPNISGSAGSDRGGAGDAQLTILGGNTTFDACGLEFDFVALCDTISIAYVFASEEYDEYVCGTVNDVFAFFLTGPGYANTNIATIPNTNIPVSINTVNNGSIGGSGGGGATNCNLTNTAYYLNSFTTTHEYDGQTVRLIARAAIQPCSTYRVKLVVADGGDGIFDSGVFLEQNGITCNSSFFAVQSTLTAPLATNAIEGCINGAFVFTRQGDSTQASALSYTIGGTATPGADYQNISGTVVFGVNQTAVTVPITAFADGIAEGTETIQIIIRDTICGTVTADTATITITDRLLVSAGADQTVCIGDPIQIGAANVAGLTYSWSPTSGLSNPNISNPVATPPTGGGITYIVTANDGNGCIGRDTVLVNTPQISSSTIGFAQNVSCNGLADGCAEVVAVGGSGNFSYLWSNGSTNDTVCGLAPGTYTVTVTDTTYVGGSANVAYFENFDGAQTWTLNVPTGVNGADPNFWVVNDNEGGVPPPGCGVAGNLDNTLHITSVFNPGGGAAYDAGGLCGLLFCPETNMRAESPVINATGLNNLTLSFDFISNGDALLDNASVLYFNGAAWSTLVPSIKSPTCVSGQGQWTAFSVALPASANNNPNIRVGFNWTNNDDGIGTDPSVAINNVRVSTANSGAFILCTTTATAIITEPTPLNLNLTPTNVACFGDSTGCVTAAASGSNGNYAFDWSTGASTAQVCNLPAGSYIVTLTDSITGGVPCVIIDTMTLTQSPDLNIVATSYSVTCNAASDGAIDLALSGGSPGYTVTWSNSASGDSIGGLNGGSYTATITDNLGCIDTLTVAVPEPPAIVSSTSMVPVSCNGGADGCAEVTASGGPGGNFTFTWSNGMTGDSICGLAAGTYYVTITDTTNGGGVQNLVVYNENFDVLPPWTLNVPTGPNGADPNFWVVNDNEGGVAPGGCGIANNGNGTLHVTSVFFPAGGAAYDAGGLCGLLFCPETNARAESPAFSTVGLTGLTLEFDFISQGDGLLDNASVVYNDGSGWQVLAPSIKSLVCASGQGLWQAATFALPASCNNQPAVQVGINWSNNDDGIGTDPSVAINNVRVTSAINVPGGAACTHVDSVIVTAPSALTLSMAQTDAPCSTATGTATVTPAGATPGYTYVWSTVPTQTGATATGLIPGSYTVTVTDANACQATATVQIGNIPGPDISIALINPVSCFGGNNGSAIASVLGGSAPVNVSWGTVPVQTGLTATGLSAGTWIATATDANGCIDTAQARVPQPPVLSTAITGTNAICLLNTGSAVATASGGVAPYTFVWSNNQSGPNIGNLAAGTYTVTATDSRGCQATASVVILQEGSPVPTITGHTDVTCFGGNNGSASVSATLGVAPYTFTWGTVPTQTGPNAVNLAAGTYTVTVTDDNGCQNITSVTIAQPTPLTAPSVATDVACWATQNPNGTIGVIASGGTPSYSYLWSTVPAQTTSFATGLAPGIYSVTITDRNGCQLTVRDTVGLQASPVVVAGPDASFCEGEGGALVFASATGGAPGYYYQWWCDSTNTFCGLDSINDNDPIANPTVSTWYYVVAIDTNGCMSNVDSLIVRVEPKPVVNAGPDQYICGDSAPCAILQPTISGASGPYTFNWSPGTSLNDSTIMNPCARPDSTTIYALTVVAGNGCASDFTATDTNATVTVHVNPIPIADAGPDRDLCLGDSLLLQGIGYGAGPAYAFEWSPSTGLSSTSITNPSASPPTTTDYTLTVWSNGCPSYADTVEVRVHTIPTVDAGWDREICYNGSVLIDAQAGGDSTATYAFQWTPPLGLDDATLEDPTASPANTTTYYVQAITNWGCESAPDSATVYVVPTPIADAGPSLFLCAGDTVQLQGAFSYMTADTAPASQIYYAWTPASHISDTTLLQPLIWPTQSGWYHLEIRHRVCATSDSVLITVGPQVAALADADSLVICGRDSVQLLSLGSIGPNLHWYPSTGLSDPFAANPMAAPDSTTTYYLAVGDGGCHDTAAVTVSVLPTPTAGYFSSLTEGCVPHQVSFIDASNGAVNHIWNFGDGTPVSNMLQPIHTYETPGTYTVSLVVQTGGACSDTISDISVVVYDSAQAGFVTTPSFPVEMSLPNTQVAFQNTSVNASSWVWEFGDGITNTDVNPTHSYQDPGTYFATLVVYNVHGCISRIVHGPFVVVSPELFIPNVFSPNGDGINDVFRVEYTGSQPFSLQIFDRWGALINSNVNKNDGWDGSTLNGDASPDGVYYYHVEVGGRAYTGVVTLMR
jgi:gliding motility-associated-like protein